MKKILTSILLLVSLIPALGLAQINPIGIDITTGQAKVNTTVQIQASGSGTVVDTGSTQTITGAKTLSGSNTFSNTNTFSGANALVLPDNDPTTDRGLGFENNILKSHDGTAARIYVPADWLGQSLYNICFKQGGDSSILSISSCSAAAALSASNPGIVRIRSSTAGTIRTFVVTADVTLDLTGAHWGLDAKGNVTGAIIRVYPIDDNATLRWGVGYQGGFYYIRNTQDDTTATNINLPEEIFSNGNVATDNSPMRDAGWILANFTDATNEWAITEYHPNESADGIWQPWMTTYSGFSANPSGGYRRWTQDGKTIIIEESPDTNGTSNATTFGMDLPIKAQQTLPTSTTIRVIGATVVNNSVVGTATNLGFSTTNASVSLALYRDAAAAAWTSSNAKRGMFQLIYEAYQP